MGVGLDEQVLVQFKYEQFTPNPEQVDRGVKGREELEVRFFANGELPIGFARYVNGTELIISQRGQELLDMIPVTLTYQNLK